MPFISRNRKYFNNTYENVDRNTPIFASDIEAIAGKEGVSIMTNPAFYIMTSTSTNTVSNGYLVTYDLGKDCKGVNYINYNPICVPNRYPACILNNVQASPDNKNWVTISSRFGSRNVNSQLDFPTPNTYRFLRFTTSNDDGNYGSGGVNSFKINYIKQELVSSEEGTEDNHNSFIDTDKRLYNFVTNKRHYYKYGTEPNATVVGSPTIDDGVVSGFSASNYLVYPVAFTPDTQTWEKVFKYITGSTVTDGTIYSNGTVDKCGDSLFIYGSKPRFLIGYTASAWNVDSTANYTLSPNTSYWFKISFTGTSYNVDVSTNGTDYENIISVASSTVITANMSQLNIGQRLGYSSPLTSGSIDFSQSYIKINGKEWWHGTKAIEIPASEIDNWGTTRYFKNVVTTKYWKEITTGSRELEYAFYTHNGGKNGMYAKVPLGSDLTSYIDSATAGVMVNSSSELIVHPYGWDWQSVADDKAVALELLTNKPVEYPRYPEGDLYVDTTVTETVEGTPEDYTYTTEESSIIEVTADDDYDFTESTPPDGFDYYLDRIVNYFPVKRSGNAFVPVFESESAGTFEVNLPKGNKYRISIVGGGGAAAMKGVYDDRGYGWTGGSGGAFVGEFELPAGIYSVTVGSANNNTIAQSGNTQTLNPSDRTTHDSYITGIIRVGGGGAGTTSGVGAAGAAATFEIEPTYIELNTKGNAGSSGSGGKGSGANWTHNGAASVYKGHGKGQGCSTSEYGSRRYWIAGTNGYVKIGIWSESEKRLY